MASFLKDLRYAARILVANPTFTIAAVLCLALGIGLNTAIFSVVHAVLLRPLNYREPGRLYRLYTEFPTFPNGGLRRFAVSVPEFYELSHELNSWESMDAWLTAGTNLAGAAEPIRVNSCFITGGLFHSLGVSPALGRTISPSDDDPGAPLTVVISHGLWLRAFGADASILGRVVQVNGQNANIIGVMAPDFTFPPGDLNPPELWEAFQLGPPDPKRRGGHFLSLLGRLKPGVTLHQATDEIALHVRQSIDRVGPKNHPFDPKVHTIVTYALQDEVVRAIRPALWTLMGAVGFVLLIACVNVANLLLARAEARQREIAIRKALGAGLAQLTRQFIAEGLLLSLAGGALGVLAAVATLRTLISAGRANIPRASEVSVDPAVLAVTLGVCLLTAVVFGFAPLAHITAGTLHDALKAASGRSSGSVASNRFRSVLVSAELALALVLLIGTGLMIRAFWKLADVNPGFEPDRLLTMRVNLPQTVYPKGENITRFWQNVQQGVAAIPGVQSVTMMSGLPPQRAIQANDTQIENFVMVRGGPMQNIDYWQNTGDHFFETMGMRLVEGRFFDERDGKGGAPTVIVNQAMARMFYGNRSPIGRRVRSGVTDPWRTIVGVVADVKNSALDLPAGTELFFPYQQEGYSTLQAYVVVKAAGDPKSLVSPVRSAIHAIDPALPVAQVLTMDEVMAGARSRPRFLTTLLSLFSMTALILAAVGLYGVISYAVTRRTTEFGIRMALGASAADVTGLVLRHGMTLAVAGVAAGAAGALILTRLIRGLLFGIDAFDPLTFAAMALLLAGVAAVASIVPARRATRCDPMVALRYE
ncbi:MAG TPA: ABC transporter permease [Bryobacteraceae bacterium]|nr:ABC transporter permease [Bryobacteraceae bacterium]